jgi:hypothetical protein
MIEARYAVGVGLVIAIVGCKGKETPPDKPPATSTAEPASAQPPPAAQPDQAAAAPEISEIPDGLEAREPIYCEGKQELALVKVYIKAADHAALIRGDCTVAITDSHLIGGSRGVVVEGTARVVIRGSIIEGKHAAIHVSGRGRLEATATKFVGAKKVEGKGQYKDGDGNSWE